MLEALKQDCALRHASAPEAKLRFTGCTRLLARTWAAALLALLYCVVLPVTVWASVLCAVYAWLVGRSPAVVVPGAEHSSGVTNGHGKPHGTALVSGEHLSFCLI